MGSTELALILKYVVPLAIKLANDGKDETETVTEIVSVINNIDKSPDAIETLANADPEQTKSIIDGLFNVITGVAGAPFFLISSLVGLIFGRKKVGG